MCKITNLYELLCAIGCGIIAILKRHIAAFLNTDYSSRSDIYHYQT